MGLSPGKHYIHDKKPVYCGSILANALFFQLLRHADEILPEEKGRKSNAGEGEGFRGHWKIDITGR